MPTRRYRAIPTTEDGAQSSPTVSGEPCYPFRNKDEDQQPQSHDASFYNTPMPTTILPSLRMFERDISRKQSSSIIPPYADSQAPQPPPTANFLTSSLINKQGIPQQQNQYDPRNQQTILSRNAYTTFNHANAPLYHSACIIPPNIRDFSVTSFTYVVLCQYVKATFVPTDRKCNRSKTPLGHVGLKCKHCEGQGEIQSGRYFPSACKSFADKKKTLLPMYKHLMLCQKCPEDTKEFISNLHDRHELELRALKGKKGRIHGSQNAFLRRVWKSLHADDGSKRDHRKGSHGVEKEDKVNASTISIGESVVAEALLQRPSYAGQRGIMYG
jgi:hypothetical protein